MKYPNRAAYWEKLCRKTSVAHYVGKVRRKTGDLMKGICGVEGAAQPRKPQGEIVDLCKNCYRVMGVA